jgi:hypothetical protein
MPNCLLRRSPLTALAAIVIASVLAPPGSAATPATYSQAVTQICAHALMFESSHSMGTRAGALDLASDIRSSADRRLASVAALPVPHRQVRTVARWLALERRLSELYALTYVRVWDLVAEPRTPEQRPEAARRLARLMHGPDPMRRAAARLEQRLRVPDCTGG